MRGWIWKDLDLGFASLLKFKIIQMHEVFHTSCMTPHVCIQVPSQKPKTWGSIQLCTADKQSICSWPTRMWDKSIFHLSLLLFSFLKKKFESLFWVSLMMKPLLYNMSFYILFFPPSWDNLQHSVESETVQAVPKGLATGRNAKPLWFGTIIQVIKFNFRNVATGNCF